MRRLYEKAHRAFAEAQGKAGTSTYHQLDDLFNHVPMTDDFVMVTSAEEFETAFRQSLALPSSWILVFHSVDILVHAWFSSDIAQIAATLGQLTFEHI